MTAVAAGELAPFAALALGNIQRAYPCKPDHTLTGDADIQTPHALHPVFYGSYDWHSSVHMHWLLARLLRLRAAPGDEPAIHDVFDAHFTAPHVAAELAYFERPASATFERTYGWAWLLKLQLELTQIASTDDCARKWAGALAPLADALVDRYLQFLQLAPYPIRAGTHANSAFGLLFALDYAEAGQHFALRKLIHEKAHRWFARDANYPAQYEPSGDDFFSAGLIEAQLMLRVVGKSGFADWWAGFCPAPAALQTWLTPVASRDRSDAKLSHLDGLNLSRAWCWRVLQPALPPQLQPMVKVAIAQHLEAALPHVTDGHYVGTHWLASFAALALTETKTGTPQPKAG